MRTFPVLLLALAGLTATAMPVQPALNGAWYSPSLAGQGLHLEILSPVRALVIWATYDGAGQPLWLYGDGRIEGERILFDAYAGRDGRFPDHPQPGVIEPWGQLQLAVASCSELTLSWTPITGDPAPGSLAFERLASTAGPACVPPQRTWLFTDLGRLPAGASRGFGGPQLVRAGSEWLVATTDGLWRRGGDHWQPVGLQGIDLAFLQSDAASGRLYAGGDSRQTGRRPFFRSDDAGQSWIEAAQTPAHDPNAGTPFEPFAALAIHPQNPDLLYANLIGSAGLAWSIDGGLHWQRVDGQSQPLFGYACTISLLPDQPDRLYQGCEFGLDIIQIGYYPIQRQAPGALGAFVTLVPDPFGDFQIDNRRPQRLGYAFARPGTLYAGIEGALIAIDPQGHVERVYHTPIGSEPEPYIYVEAFWIDPANPSHLIYGGGLNGEETELQLYESWDHGNSRQRLPAPPQTVVDQEVQSLLALDERGHRFAVLVYEQDTIDAPVQLRVLLLERGQ